MGCGVSHASGVAGGCMTNSIYYIWYIPCQTRALSGSQYATSLAPAAVMSIAYILPGQALAALAAELSEASLLMMSHSVCPSPSPQAAWHRAATDGCTAVADNVRAGVLPGVAWGRYHQRAIHGAPVGGD